MQLPLLLFLVCNTKNVGIKIEKLNHNDLHKFTGLIRLFDVFEMKNFEIPDEGYRQQLLEQDGFCFCGIARQPSCWRLTSYIMQQ